MQQQGGQEFEWPKDERAERSVLGAIFIEWEAIYRVMDKLVADDFYSDAHRLIYSTMLEFAERGDPFDWTVISSTLEAREQLDRIKGGANYLAELPRWVPTSYHAELYAGLVAKAAIDRGLMKGAYQIFDLAAGRDTDSAGKAEQIIREAVARSGEDGGAMMDTIIQSYSLRLDEAYKRKKAGLPRGVPTPWVEINTQTGTLQKGDLIILGARAAVGKTSMALNLARYVAEQGIPVLIFSMEMSRDSLGERLLADVALIDSQRLRQGDVWERHPATGKDEWDIILEARGHLESLPIIVEDKPAITTLEMRAKARRWQQKVGVGLVIIDYLQQATIAGKPRENRVQEVSEVTRHLKVMARELNVPVLALAQINRAGAVSEEPELHHLKDSGQLEQEADLVPLIFVENTPENLKKLEDHQPYTVIWKLAKNRNGPIGKIALTFHPRITRFTNGPQIHHAALAERADPYADDRDEEEESV